MKNDYLECNQNVTETIDCLESYLDRHIFKDCRIPWKLPFDRQQRNIEFQ